MAEAGPSEEPSILPIESSLSLLEVKDERQQVIDERQQQVIEWIHKNAFPSMELHLQIWSKFKTSLEHDHDIIKRHLNTGTLPVNVTYTELLYLSRHYEILHLELNNFIKNPGRSIVNVVMISQLFFNLLRDTNLTTPGITALNDEYNKHGYYYRYFGWVNTNFDPVAAKLNTLVKYDDFYNTKSDLALLKQTKDRLSLSPETFEQGLPMLNNKIFQQIIKFIQTPTESGPLSKLTMNNLGYKKKSLNVNRYVGWTKRSLDFALVKSELAVNPIDGHMYKYPSIPKSLISPELKGKLSGFRPDRTKYDESYMPLLYYGTVYRKLYPTKPYVHKIQVSKPRLKLKIDPVDELVKWIHTNTFPSKELHAKILNDVLLKFASIEPEELEDTTALLIEQIKLYIEDRNLNHINYIANIMANELFNDKLYNLIIDEYFKHGYVYGYFGWLNTNFFPVRAKGIVGPVTEKIYDTLKNYKLKLTPHNFEQGMPQLTLTSYNNTIKIIKRGYVTSLKHMYGKMFVSQTTGSKFTDKRLVNINRYIGWHRTDLESAILGSGLTVKNSKTGAMDVPKTLFDPTLSGKLPSFNLGDVTGMLTPIYYGTIYRKIFGTMTYIDWRLICKNKLQKYDILKFIAVNDFGLDYTYVKTLKYDELCSLLEKKAKDGRVARLEMGEEAREIAPALLYQPGSFLVPTPSGFAPTETTEYVPPEWQELANSCANPGSVSKEYLAFIAQRMGVRESLPKDLSGMSNDQICKSLLNYVTLLQRGKEVI